MSITIGGMAFSFECRKCGRRRKAQFNVPYPVTKAYAAKRVGMRNTRWGAQCIPSCTGIEVEAPL